MLNAAYSNNPGYIGILRYGYRIGNTADLHAVPSRLGQKPEIAPKQKKL